MDRMEWLEQSRLTVVVGYSGSGKTEFSVNLALALARQGKRTALADLDVVNPYFRSRERRDLLSHEGVRLIATSQACVDADVPAMPAEVNVLFQDQDLWGVLDIGGGTGPISAATAGVPMPGPICPQRPPASDTRRGRSSGQSGGDPGGHRIESDRTGRQHPPVPGNRAGRPRGGSGPGPNSF